MLTQPSQSEPVWLTVARLLRWDKPAGRLILMIPALWAVVLAANGTPPWQLVLVIILGSLATSAAGCVVNDLWDRDIDPQVARTRNRPLAARALSIKTGIGVAIVAFACAWGLAAYLNPFSFWLCVAAVPFILLYPLAKRVFPVPQLVLSLCWGFTVLISWSAVTAGLDRAAWLLWGATVLWTLAFDTVYAMADREDDERIGVNSSARFFGAQSPLVVGLCLVGSVLLLVGEGLTTSLGWGYWLALIGVGAGWLWHYWQLRASHPDPNLYGQVFRQNVWLGFVLLIGMIVGALF
ncbi:4-hydroxybenzoate solanesyltransferase [Leptolyngbya sp. NK1-12]|uniref:4-hydroxybenzoate solanesyltransferase n=1 Tax=Leptolyngbya sp. NK1-12 TaxID=2547451 RepID=A0AA97AEB7_9CYAN|nr:4-hydroxybenzoate solanesyltransferase [Leptolyngbya sp. NK1-12]WNZ21855.1 4-hydroxybenzoate solanesyltransferase [Leptolyngbya sp. NK1-12]